MSRDSYNNVIVVTNVFILEFLSASSRSATILFY